MIGVPVCGDTDSFNKSSHETLCIRWYIAAATMPYFRVSSGILPTYIIVILYTVLVPTIFDVFLRELRQITNFCLRLRMSFF